MQTELPESPAERRRTKVRELILSAAENVFAREGNEGLSIRRLAREVDYSPAAIYKYFGSKDELVDELKEAFFAKLLQRVHMLADQNRPYGDRARSCISEYIHVARQNPNHYGAAFAATDAEPVQDFNSPEFAESNKGLAFGVLKSLVQEGIDKGYLRANLDVALAAKSIWCSMHGLAMMLLHIPCFPSMDRHGATYSQDEFVAYHADLVMRGLEAVT